MISSSSGYGIGLCKDCYDGPTRVSTGVLERIVSQATLALLVACCLLQSPSWGLL